MKVWEKERFAREIKEKDSIEEPFLVKYSALQIGKTGKPYLNIVLMDKTGELEGRIWDDVADHAGQVVQDAFVLVKGKCQTFQGRRQVIVKSAQVLREDEVRVSDYVLDTALSIDDVEAELHQFIESMQSEALQKLSRAVLIEDEEVRTNLRLAPAAKSMHHAYRGGLLEHIVSISKLLDALAAHYSQLNRDLLLIGGFFHDIGKIWELRYDRVFDYTTEGRLIGHHIIGVELVERKVQEIRATGFHFSEELNLLVKHMIIAHHGKLEYGSPKRPKFLEALVVHYIDDLDSKIQAIDDFIQRDQNEGDWTAYHRNFDRYFLKNPNLN